MEKTKIKYGGLHDFLFNESYPNFLRTEYKDKQNRK